MHNKINVLEANDFQANYPTKLRLSCPATSTLSMTIIYVDYISIKYKDFLKIVSVVVVAIGKLT